jgi:hypothetical protein
VLASQLPGSAASQLQLGDAQCRTTKGSNLAVAPTLFRDPGYGVEAVPTVQVEKPLLRTLPYLPEGTGEDGIPTFGWTAVSIKLGARQQLMLTLSSIALVFLRSRRRQPPEGFGGRF